MMVRKFGLRLFVLCLVLAAMVPLAQAQVALKLGGVQADDGRAIAVDASGNSYVTGRFRLTVDFDPGPGTFELTPTSGYARYVASYDPAGALRYALKIDGASLPEAGIAVDGADNVYVTGAFGGIIDFDPGAATQTLFSSEGRIFVASYDGSGNYRFAINFGLLTSTLERGTSIVVDAAGNSYLTGAFNGLADFDPTPADLLVQANGFTDAFLASYTTNGAVRFAIGIGGIESDEGKGIAIDGAGNLYIAGSFRDTVDFDPSATQLALTSNGVEDLFLASYDSAGALRYAIGAGDTGTDRGNAVAVDSMGNAYLAGDFAGTVDFDPGAGQVLLTTPNGNTDIVLASYDGTGALRYAYGFGDDNPDQALGATVDAQDNVYITGQFRNTIDFDPGPADRSVSVFGTAAFVASYTGSGAYREAYAFERIGSGDSVGHGIAVDGSGRPSVIGTFGGTVDFDPGAATNSLTSAGSNDMFLSSYFPGVLGPGSIPIASLTVTRAVDRNVILDWSASCSLASVDYAIYEGELGNWYTHDVELCTDAGGDLTEEITTEAGDRYFLVVPLVPGEEGSYGTDSGGTERPVGINVCRPVQSTESCP